MIVTLGDAQQTGDWFSVPDTAVVGQPARDVPILGKRYFFVLPDGSTILLDPAEVHLESDWMNVFRSSDWTYHNIRIRLTRNTAPGLLAYGLVTPAQVQNHRPLPPEKPGVLDWLSDAQKTTQSTVRAMMVLGVIGAAIYFLPKDIVRDGYAASKRRRR